jgi:hypothetical protein
MNELLIGRSSFTERTNMSSPLPEIFLNGQLAKRRLEEVFDTTGYGHQPPHSTGNVQVATGQSESFQPQRRALTLARSRDIFRASTGKTSKPKSSDRNNGDMTASCFTLTLLFIATFTAAYTDRPAFWLLVGPVPLAAGLALIACFQQGRLIWPHFKTPRCKSGSNCSA